MAESARVLATTSVGTPAGSVRRGRFAVSAIFAVHGTVQGTYASRLPWLQNHIHAAPGVLGAVMVAQAVGALLAAPATGMLVHRFGAKSGMRLMLIWFTAWLALPALMPSAWTLAPVLLGFGAAAGCADVAMNAHGVRIERRAGKSIMSGLHGLWAVGMICGSAVGGLCAAAGIGAVPEFFVTAILLTALAVPICSLLPADDPVHPDVDVPTPRYALPSRAILFIGILAFCGVFAEGAADNWSAVYVTHVGGASAAVGAYCLTGFSVTMAIGRLTGDAVTRHFGPLATVRAGGLVAVAGACLVIAARAAVPAIAGFGLLGLGIATVVPLAIAATGRLDANVDTNSAVAGVTTVVYAGALAAGPVIGALGSAVSLPFAFGAVAVAAVGIALSARAAL
ncbi:MAG TPA: MFS transporter [Thermoleophilia bacterium]|nr:MFS transporter [Thermoleophilia bacterium]